jgi:hypothetical protein
MSRVGSIVCRRRPEPGATKRKQEDVESSAVVPKRARPAPAPIAAVILAPVPPPTPLAVVVAPFVDPLTLVSFAGLGDIAGAKHGEYVAHMHRFLRALPGGKTVPGIASVRAIVLRGACGVGKRVCAEVASRMSNLRPLYIDAMDGDSRTPAALFKTLQEAIMLCESRVVIFRYDGVWGSLGSEDEGSAREKTGASLLVRLQQLWAHKVFGARTPMNPLIILLGTCCAGTINDRGFREFCALPNLLGGMRQELPLLTQAQCGALCVNLIASCVPTPTARVDVRRACTSLSMQTTLWALQRAAYELSRGDARIVTLATQRALDGVVVVVKDLQAIMQRVQAYFGTWGGASSADSQVLAHGNIFGQAKACFAWRTYPANGEVRRNLEAFVQDDVSRMTAMLAHNGAFEFEFAPGRPRNAYMELHDTASLCDRMFGFFALRQGSELAGAGATTYAEIGAQIALMGFSRCGARGGASGNVEFPPCLKKPPEPSDAQRRWKADYFGGLDADHRGRGVALVETALGDWSFSAVVKKKDAFAASSSSSWRQKRAA